ncbi:hypothetical protein BASA82_000184 [Batrachochytrium salamandrivorans]|nr:hypothetical protein BASA82_000184 [Batrachochytrium salamandrivorans]
MLPRASLLRRFSQARTVRDILDEKRGYLAGEDSARLADHQQQGHGGPRAGQDAQEHHLRPGGHERGPGRGPHLRQGLPQARPKRKQSASLPADEQLAISEIMTPASKLVACTYTDTAESCQDMMVKNKVRFLPVLLNGKLHGVLSFSDFLARPSRFEPDARRAIFAEENVGVVSDDYSFSLSDLEGDKIKEELAKRVNAVKNRQL